MRSPEAYIAKFNRDYADRAIEGFTAYQTWQKMKKEGWFGVDIAKHFGVSENTIVEWNKKFRPRLDSLST